MRDSGNLQDSSPTLLAARGGVRKWVFRLALCKTPDHGMSARVVSFWGAGFFAIATKNVGMAPSDVSIGFQRGPVQPETGSRHVLATHCITGAHCRPSVNPINIFVVYIK